MASEFLPSSNARIVQARASAKVPMALLRVPVPAGGSSRGLRDGKLAGSVALPFAVPSIRSISLKCVAPDPDGSKALEFETCASAQSSDSQIPSRHKSSQSQPHDSPTQHVLNMRSSFPMTLSTPTPNSPRQKHFNPTNNSQIRASSLVLESETATDGDTSNATSFPSGSHSVTRDGLEHSLSRNDRQHNRASTSAASRGRSAWRSTAPNGVKRESKDAAGTRSRRWARLESEVPSKIDDSTGDASGDAAPANVDEDSIRVERNLALYNRWVREGGRYALSLRSVSQEPFSPPSILC